MKALENIRNIAKTAREFGIHRKQVGGQEPNSLWAQFVFRAHPMVADSDFEFEFELTTQIQT